MVSPNLFIVGPPRTGTTSLIEWLALHPDVARPSLKEPMFHAHDLASPQQVADVDEYLGLYADLGRAAYYIDATPWYMFSRQAAASIYEAAPDAHVIITLRNPVQVLSSLHARHVLVGLEPEPDFARAVLDGPRKEDPIEFRRSLDYLAVGRFGEQTARFTDLFPPEQVHFVLMRDMAQRPRRMHLGLLEELGIAQLPLADYARFNEALIVRNRGVSWATARLAGLRRSNRIRRALASRVARRAAVPGQVTMPPDVGRKITAALADDIKRLQGLCGHDLSAWLGK